MNHLIENIKANLQAPLPGTTAQFKMAHAVRKHAVPPRPPANARIACVLALLYPKNEEWHIVLIERESSSNPNDRHSGQISFPGGQQEDSDPTKAFTALRETEEEIGVDPETVEMLGPTTSLYIPVSNFNVFPFLGYTQATPQFTPQESEVRSIVEVPLAHLQDPNTIKRTDIQVSQNMILRNVPYYDIEGHLLWGATAMMMSELLEVVGEL